LSVVIVVCCQVEVCATDWSLVQSSPTDCGASLCVIKKPRKRGGYSPLLGCENTTTVGCNVRKRNKPFDHLERLIDVMTLITNKMHIHNIPPYTTKLLVQLRTNTHIQQYVCLFVFLALQSIVVLFSQPGSGF
jgi:hypothetical protein